MSAATITGSSCSEETHGPSRRSYCSASSFHTRSPVAALVSTVPSACIKEMPTASKPGTDACAAHAIASRGSSRLCDRLMLRAASASDAAKPERSERSECCEVEELLDTETPGGPAWQATREAFEQQRDAENLRTGPRLEPARYATHGSSSLVRRTSQWAAARLRHRAPDGVARTRGITRPGGGRGVAT